LPELEALNFGNPGNSGNFGKGRFGALGDIHGDFASARRVMERHADVPFWLCVGDVAGEHGRYEPLPVPLYWIKGNNENFDAIAGGVFPDNLHYVPNAEPVTVAGVRVLGLGGTLAPTLYDTPAAELPHPRKGTAKATAVADRRRHFVREEVERCKSIADVDVFLSHEAPRPFKVGRIEAGKLPINEVLEAAAPKLHLFGHHHRYEARQLKGVTSICLDLVSKSYLLIDRHSFSFSHETRSA
jgi:uncharacterized protein